MRALMWGGLVLSLTLMVAATALTLLAEKRWGLYLFVGAAVLYLLCRCATMGLLNTAPKALTVVFLIAGSFILSKWTPLSAMGILGMACLGAALACVLLYGLGLARQRPSPPARGA
jgi:hypothetical protein